MTEGPTGKALDTTEATRLEACERIISRGLKTFIEVGNALVEIRDKRLYRAKYSTFDEYCKEQWGLSSRRVNQTIAAATVAGTIVPGGPVPANEGQARELVGLTGEQAAEVMRRAEGTGLKITAILLKDLRHELEDETPDRTPIPPSDFKFPRLLMALIESDRLQRITVRSVIEEMPIEDLKGLKSVRRCFEEFTGDELEIPTRGDFKEEARRWVARRLAGADSQARSEGVIIWIHPDLHPGEEQQLG